jgi:hypothetical protein
MGGSGLLLCSPTPERHSVGSPIAADFRMFGQRGADKSSRAIFSSSWRSRPRKCNASSSFEKTPGNDKCGAGSDNAGRPVPMDAGRHDAADNQKLQKPPHHFLILH